MDSNPHLSRYTVPTHGSLQHAAAIRINRLERQTATIIPFQTSVRLTTLANQTSLFSGAWSEVG